jgi:hypothetical protein
VDEKWFFLTKQQQSTYLAQGEKPPKRSLRNKLHITKVIFLCAVARPQKISYKQWCLSKINTHKSEPQNTYIRHKDSFGTNSTKHTFWAMWIDSQSKYN